MIKKIDITNPILAEQVLNVQIPSYRVEAEIIDFYDIPPIKDSVQSLQKCGETFYGYYIDDELCGAISFKIANNTLDIHRLIVHPNHFRKGIANQLLLYVENNEAEVESIIVSTSSKNIPAIYLYMKNGFSKTGETQITEGLSLSSFNKKLRST